MKNKNKDEWAAACRNYYQSDDWQWVREQVIKRDRKCVKCDLPYRRGETTWNVHHTSYEHFGASDLWEVEDCLLHCQSCHRQVHHLRPLGEIEDEADRIMGWVE